MCCFRSCLHRLEAQRGVVRSKKASKDDFADLRTAYDTYACFAEDTLDFIGTLQFSPRRGEN